MGMNSYVVLLRSKDDPTYKKYLRVLLGCEAANVTLPPEVDAYFGGTTEPEFPLEISYKPREWADECSMGFEVDVDDLPPGVKTIRFVNSW